MVYNLVDGQYAYSVDLTKIAHIKNHRDAIQKDFTIVYVGGYELKLNFQTPQLRMDEFAKLKDAWEMEMDEVRPVRLDEL